MLTGWICSFHIMKTQVLSEPSVQHSYAETSSSRARVAQPAWLTLPGGKEAPGEGGGSRCLCQGAASWDFQTLDSWKRHSSLP